MRKKHRSKSKKRHSLVRRHAKIIFLASALFIGVVFAQNGLNNQGKNPPPKIDSISPAPVVIDKEFTVSGSGFTTEEEYKGPPRGDKVLSDYPGNWYQIKGLLQGPPALSSDGKTIKFPGLNLSSKQIPENCQTETTGKKCQVPFQVVNGYGVPSNVKHIEIFIPEIKPLIFSSGYSPDNPATLNVSPGATDVDVLKVKMKADAQNTSDIKIDSLMLQTGPVSQAIDCYNTFASVNAYEVESDQLVGLGVLGPAWFGPGCWDMVPIEERIVLPPGTEKTILLKMSLKSTAQVGLQFNIGATPYPGGYIQWVDYEGPQGSGPTITIVSP